VTKIFVKVKPNSKTEEVRHIDETHFEVRVKEPPTEGRANRAVVKALADYLRIPTSRIGIKSGLSSRTKVLEIFD
jgi:hypothetical protein